MMANQIAENRFGFRVDKKISEVLQSDEFHISAEVIPPRNGAEQEKILDQIDKLVGAGAEFLSVTKGAGGSLRGGSLPIAQAVKEKFSRPCIAHFTCRDLSVQEVENQLMDHHYFGVRNILALRGDPPQDQPDWNPHNQSYQYAYQLIEQIVRLNQGEFLKRPGGLNPEDREATDFCIGAAAYPEHPDPTERFDFFNLKVQAGAEYGITQMIFDVEKYADFLELCAKNNINLPILPGTLILKSKKQAMGISNRFGVSINAKLLEKLPEKRPEGEIDYALDIFFEYVEDLKKAGAPGVHLFVLSDTKGCSSAIERMSSELKR